jgi:hypothetical protein
MHKNATKCNETIGKWCKNKHGASKIIDTFETYQRVMSKLDRCVSMHVIELAEHGARTGPVNLILSHLAEEYEVRPLQGLRNLDGVDDMVEWCAQVHHDDVRGVLLWERSVLLLWRKAFKRRARGAR